jgi:Cu(I)/Ag(I) efflux system membrane fusion protein
MKVLSGKLILVGVSIAVGIALGFFLSTPGADTATNTPKKKEPLYWVAPMDANFRRDSPGKSPMGMALVPVYAEATPVDGAITVSANVEHNLGVRTARVRLGRMTDRITTLADVRYNEDLMVTIYPRVEGWIEKLFIKSEGVSVNAGQALYEIYSPELVNAQQEMITALKRGNQLLIASARERLKSLQIHQNDIDRLENSAAGKSTAKRTITVYAPRAGIVSELGVREGNFVVPRTPVMSIAGMESVWITSDIFERDISNIHRGDLITFDFDSLPGSRIAATIDFIYPVLDEMTRTVKIRSTVENTQRRFIINMYAKATIEPQSTNDTVLVPKHAVIRTAAQNRVVLKIGPGQYKSVNVHLGRINHTEAEVLQGLEPGDEVVIQAQFLLDSESSVSSDFMRMGLMDTDEEDGVRP